MEMAKGISVIMPSYLGEYPGSRENPDKKFIRAVKSFQSNKSLENKQLVIVSDGCEITNDLYEKHFKEDSDITLIRCEKSDYSWPGVLREAGRSIAKYDWIAYLDSDDLYFPNHLAKAYLAILKRKEETTVLFNTHYIMPFHKEPTPYHLLYLGKTLSEYKELYDTLQEYEFEGKPCRVAMTNTKGENGTWQIIHYKNVPHRWESTDEIGEDRDFIERLKTTEKYEKFKGIYMHCHLNVDLNLCWDY